MLYRTLFFTVFLLFFTVFSISFLNSKDYGKVKVSKEIHHDHDNHKHGKDCGHTPVKHNDHIDNLHDGHLHHYDKEGQYHDHVIEVTGKNPNQHSPVDHSDEHVHSPDCGHETVPHGNHLDYYVDGKLHDVHDDHCDDHGPLQMVEDSK